MRVVVAWLVALLCSGGATTTRSQNIMALTWTQVFTDDFEAGDPVTLHYESDIEGYGDPGPDVSNYWTNAAGAGRDGSRGLRAPSGSERGNSFDRKLSEMTAVIDYLHPYRYGRAQFDVNLDAGPAAWDDLFVGEVNWGGQVIYDGVYDEYDYLFYVQYWTSGAIRIYSPNYIWGTPSTATSAAGVLTLGTWQTILVEWCLSTFNAAEDEYNPDGYIRVSVNGTQVVEYAGAVGHDQVFSGYPLEGNNCWNQCWFFPQGHFDNVTVWYGAEEVVPPEPPTPVVPPVYSAPQTPCCTGGAGGTPWVDNRMIPVWWPECVGGGTVPSASDASFSEDWDPL